MPTFDIPHTTCPLCNGKIECATSTNPAGPSVGDLNVCGLCAGLLKFEVGAHLVPMTDEDMAALEPSVHDALLEARSFVIQLHRGPRVMDLTYDKGALS